MNLDRDDPRPPYLQVSHLLRAAILTGKFAPGDKLPSQAELSTHYGVARMTIQQALRILRDEGLIITRQGSGVFVRERVAKPVGLRPHIEQAFKSENVTIDFAGFTAETLHGMLTEPLDQVRAGRLSPKSIAIRLLLPDSSTPIAIPAATSGNESESSMARERMATISARHADSMRDQINELMDIGLLQSGRLEKRTYNSSPMFKAYILNRSDVFFGYYKVVRNQVRLNGELVEIFDMLGKDSALTQYAETGDPETTESQFVKETIDWYESVWNTLGVTHADDDPPRVAR